MQVAAEVDWLEAGAGQPVVLVHSSVSGARQWRRLMNDLKDAFHVRAVNLYGYGKTPPWPNTRPQTLDDQAKLVEAALPPGAQDVALVGHSFGGAFAMKAAARLGSRVTKLILVETNPFFLLRQQGRTEAFAEAAALRDCIKTCAAAGEWETAAEQFANYWGGGDWATMSPERRAAFTQALRPNVFEWDAVMDEAVPLADWVRALPRDTLLISDPRTALPIREIEPLLRKARPDWRVAHLPEGGHMAPLTAPQIVNPIIRAFLGEAR